MGLCKVAVILTSFNRKVMTLDCLRRLSQMHLPENSEMRVFLVDDRSSDGTADAVAAEFPQVDVFRGSGSLYWNGGMRAGMARAMDQGFDYYVWVNDDASLEADAFLTLVECSKRARDQLGRRAVVVGALLDPVTRKASYGGRKVAHWYRPLSYELVGLCDSETDVDVMNGNCVLIPSDVVREVGNLDGAFVHTMGDHDYALRAKRAGFRIVQAPGFVGTCFNDAVQRDRRARLATVRAHLAKVAGPKELPPRAWVTYVRRHAGFLWPIYFCKPYVAAVGRGVLGKFMGPR